MKLWLDTDIGGDIDDALALLLAMACPEEIVGVSTVFENTAARAQIAKRLLQLGGKGEVPVYAGNGWPRKAKTVYGKAVNPNATPLTYCRESFGDVVIEKDPAVEALKAAAEKADGKLTVVTMGALTNIAELIEKYPQTAQKIRCLCMMGGAVHKNLNEFNFTCDPEAADLVLTSPIPKKLISLDVTFLCEMSAGQVQKLQECRSRAVRMVMTMFRKWGGKMILHDPLALACAFSERFVGFGKGNLKVELEGSFSRGKCADLTDFNWDQMPKDDLLVSETVKNEDFLEFYVRQILALDAALCQAEESSGSKEWAAEPLKKSWTAESGLI